MFWLMGITALYYYTFLSHLCLNLTLAGMLYIFLYLNYLPYEYEHHPRDHAIDSK